MFDTIKLNYEILFAAGYRPKPWWIGASWSCRKDRRMLIMGRKNGGAGATASC